MEKFKLVLSTIFLALGLVCAVLIYNMSDKDSYGRIESTRNSSALGGSGVDSSNDGVAVGLGVISGFSFLSGTLMFTSLKERED
jgi:hypothetical protein